MTQDEFVAARTGDWDLLDSLLLQARGRGVRTLPAHEIAQLAALYRGLSGDIARAETGGFSGDLVVYLERLAARAHATLYAAPPWRVKLVWDFIAGGFPASLRAQRRFFLVSCLLFFVPMLASFAAAALSPTFAERVLPASALAQAAESYGDRFGGGRGEGEGAMMTGFYIYNNIGIAFRCFATGVFFGLGSVFFLVYNGVAIGTTLGYVVRLGYGANILSFVVGHSPFELTAIAVAGAAGLRLGYAMIRTGGETRLGSLRRQGPEILQLVMGAAFLLLIAALIEGLWSGSALPRMVKFSAGGMLALLVAVYLGFGGNVGDSEARR